MVNSKLFGWLFSVLLVAMTIGGATAYFDWKQPLTTGSATTDPYIDNQVMSYLQVPASNIASDCPIPTTSFYQLLSDPETHNIWVQEYSQISIYSKTCGLLFQKLVNGTTSSNGFIYDWDGDGKPQLLTTIKTPDNTISFVSYEWNGSVITNDFTLDLGASVVATSSVYCARGTDICSVWNNDGYVRRIFLNSSYFLVSSAPFSNYFQNHSSGYQDWNSGLTYSPIGIVNPYGDIDGDGHDEIIYYTTNYYYITPLYHFGFDVFLYDPIDDTIDATYDFGTTQTKTQCGFGNSGAGHQMAFVGSPFVIARTGFSNSVPKIFFACSGWYSGYVSGGRVNIKILDQNFNTLNTIFEGTPLTNNGDFRLSNFVFGDYDSDSLIEHCIINKANLTCYEGDYSLIAGCQIPTYTGDSLPSRPVSLAMVDYQSGSNKEFLTTYGIKDLACNPLYQIGNYTSSNFGSFTPVDLSNDNALDWLWMDTSSGVFFSTGTGGVGGGCNKTQCPYGNCQFYDNFNYACPVNDMGWNVQNYPPSDIYPSTGRMCYDGDLLSLQSWEQTSTFYTTQINEFDINVSTSYMTTKELIYHDSTDNVQKPVWHLDFWSDGSISYYDGNSSAVSLCSNCFVPNQYTNIKVIAYFHTTNGATFYNSTSHAYEYNHPNTFSVIINNGTRFDNLDLYTDLIQGHSNSIWGVEYEWQDKTCIDNEVLRGDLTSYGNLTGCDSGFDYYTYPVVWVDTFPYADTITNHGWSGYSYVVGDNVYDACNMLFIDTNISLNPVNYTFLPPLTSDFVMKWDMWLESSLGNNTYDPIGMPTQITFERSNGTHLIHINFNSAGEIVNVLHGGGSQVLGNWDGSAEFSYKVIPNFANHTFAFYFTNASNNFEYVEACSDCAWENNGTINKFVITPYPIDPYGYTNIGIWMDNIYLTMGGTEQNFSDTQNFCNFDGCIFYDPFNYTDDTYAHGWYMFNTTPDNGVVNYSNSTQGYYFEHQIDTIHSTDNSGIFSVQFKAMFPPPPQTALDLIHFQLYNGEGAKPIDIEFSNGIIFDVNRGVASLGSYSYNSWNTYTLLVNMNTGTYNLYMNSNQLVNNGVMTIPATEIIKGGFWVNTDSAILIDYITIASGSIMVDAIGSGIVSDTGVPIADLKWCWSTTNGTFDWSCCSAEEISTKSMLCPARTTFRYALGGITNFVLGNFIYFLIIVIIFVIITPYIAPIIRGDRR